MSAGVGAFPIAGVGSLPNVSIASPGEVWSNKRAVGNIVPGAAVIPSGAGFKSLVTADTFDARQVAVAMRQVEIPDVNSGSAALGPNEIMNQLIASGDWFRRYYTGVLHLSLVVPRADYAQGQRVGWDPEGVRPAGKASGTGAWTNQSSGYVANSDIFEVFEYRVYGDSNEGLLTVRFLRSNQ